MTIFNLTSHQDLQNAFDMLCTMISPPPLGCTDYVKHRRCILRGAMKHRTDIGLCVSVITGSGDVAESFCVTLIKNPTSFVGNRSISLPVPATADLVSNWTHQVLKCDNPSLALSPKYTTG